MIRLVALALCAASPAAAHGSLPVGDGFASGVAHPFLAGEHLLLLVGLGALLGRQDSRRPLPGLVAGLICGLGLALLQPGPMRPAILVLALGIGGVLAAALRVEAGVLTVIALAAGLFIGADTDGSTTIAAFAGVVAGVFMIVLNSMALARYGAARPGGVPLRIAGSWIVAVAILLLAFLLREGMWPA
jgi:urease accessory protein